VLIITRADDLGGAQTHVRDLAVALKARGEEVIVLAGSGGALFEALEEKGVSCRLLKNLMHPINPLKDLLAYLEIKSIIKELNPDLVSTHSNKAGLLGRLAAAALGVPVVHTSHGFLFGGSGNNITCRFYCLMEKFASAHGNMVIAVAKSEYDLARRLRVIPPEKMTVIYNGLPESGFGQTARPEAEPASIIMVARFVRPKDQQTLIRAMDGLQELSWYLTLVGDGSGQPDAERLVKELGLTELVTFAGVRPDVEELLAASSIFVLSTWREGFPISVLEAMRAGLPVVASRVGGIAEAVTEGTTGLLFKAGDHAELRKCLATLINNPLLRRQMGEAGRERFLECFTLELMVEQTVAIYHKLAEA
jgi:glycosyltransferase involved in cell wall biosynthesis